MAYKYKILHLVSLLSIVHDSNWIYHASEADAKESVFFPFGKALGICVIFNGNEIASCRFTLQLLHQITIINCTVLHF